MDSLWTEAESQKTLPPPPEERERLELKLRNCGGRKKIILN